MSELVRKLNGRIEIIFGNEDQDGGVQVFEGGEAEEEIPYNTKKGLISLNESNLENPIAMVGHYELFRKPRLIGNRKFYQGVIGDAGCTLSYKFTQQRGVAEWTVAGVKYQYGKKENVSGYLEQDGSYALEVPSDVTISLYAEGVAEASVSNRFRLIVTNGTYTDVGGKAVSVDVSGGLHYTCDEKVLSQVFLDQELVFKTSAPIDAKYKTVVVEVNEVRRIIVSQSESGAVYNYGGDTLVGAEQAFAAGPIEVCWLAKCFDNQTETFDSNEIQNMEITRQLSDSEGDISYGVVSNSMKAVIYNEDRKFDVGYLKDAVFVGRRVIPYVTVDGKESRLGTYYVSERDIPMDNSWVEFSANDRLYDLQSLMYTGFFPEKVASTGKFKPESMYRVIETVFEQINENLVVQLENKMYYSAEAKELLASLKAKYNASGANAKLTALFAKMEEHLDASDEVSVLIEGVDWNYLDWSIPDPYLERQSLWNVLDDIAKSSLSVIYMDTQDRLIMHTDLYDERYFLLDGKLYVYTIQGECKEVGSDNAPFGNTITASNAFSLSKPQKKMGIATEVSTSYQSYDFTSDDHQGQGSNIITYYLKDLRPEERQEGDPDGYLRFKLHVPQYLKKTLIVCSNDSAIEVIDNKEPRSEGNRLFYNVIAKNGVDSGENCIIQGVAINNSTTKITVRNFTIPNQNALEYSAGKLLNCESNAKALADRIVTLFARGRETFESEWVGDLGYDIDLPIDFDYALTLGGKQITAKGTFRMVSNSLTFDGSLRQTVKALSYYKGE